MERDSREIIEIKVTLVLESVLIDLPYRLLLGTDFVSDISLSGNMNEKNLLRGVFWGEEVSKSSVFLLQSEAYFLKILFVPTNTTHTNIG